MRLKLFTRRFYKNFKTIENEFIGKPVNYLEVGVFLGDTAEFMINNVLTHKKSKYAGIDPWVWFKAMRKRFPTKEVWQTKVLDKIDLLRRKYNGKADFIRGYSHEVLREHYWPDNYFDLIYIDGNHTIQSVLRDYVLSWPLLKIKGVMIFDDYLQGNSDEVHTAVDTILNGLSRSRRGVNKRNVKYELLFKNYQVGIRKLAE